ncbi:alpha/beta fold hydrolase [Desulfobulbus sp. AH-315-M07]|nr:alpha/beta fold hydrolase [Desulfobulbus sp. AH-315-M07]
MSAKRLLHGFACQPAMWDDVASDPRAALTLPGHGNRPPSSASQFMDVVAEIAGTGAAPCHLIGYSMGARIALAIALSQPENCNGLLLISATAGIDEGERAERRAWDESNARMLEQHGIEAFVDHWEGLALFETQRRLSPELRRRLREHRLAHDAAGLAWAMRKLGSGNMPSMWDQLPSLRVPTRILCGELDTKYVALSERLAALLPNATVRIVDGVGHNVVLEAPDVVAEEIGQLS